MLEATGACDQAEAGLQQALPDPPQDVTALANATQAYAQGEELMDQDLRDVAAPSSVEPRIQTMAAHWDQAANEAVQAIQAYLAQDSAGYSTAQLSYTDANAAGNEIANELSLGHCSRFGYSVNMPYFP